MQGGAGSGGLTLQEGDIVKASLPWTHAGNPCCPHAWLTGTLHRTKEVGFSRQHTWNFGVRSWNPNHPHTN